MRVSQKLVFHQSKYISAIKGILYYRHVCILVFLHVFGYSMSLRCMFKVQRRACGSEDVTQYKPINNLLGFDWTCVGACQMRVNVKIAIIMAAAMTSCSTAILAEKAYSRSCTYSNKIFTRAFAGNFYEQMVAFIQNKAWNFTKYSRTRLIRHFFVGPDRIPIFCVHFRSSDSSICLIRDLFLSQRSVLFV